MACVTESCGETPLQPASTPGSACSKSRRWKSSRRKRSARPWLSRLRRSPVATSGCPRLHCRSGQRSAGPAGRPAGQGYPKGIAPVTYKARHRGAPLRATAGHARVADSARRAGLTEMRQTAWQEMLSSEPGLHDALVAIPAIVIADPNDKLVPASSLAQEGCRRWNKGILSRACDCPLTRWIARGGKGRTGAVMRRCGTQGDLKLVHGCTEKLVDKGITKQIGPNDEAAAAALLQWRGPVAASDCGLRSLESRAAGVGFR